MKDLDYLLEWLEQIKKTGTSPSDMQRYQCCVLTAILLELKQLNKRAD